MKIPKKINILSTIYDIIICEGEDSYLELKELDGEIDFVKKTIHLKKDLTENMYKVLIHELIHGIIMENMLFEESISEEVFCQQMASILGDTLIRNNMVQ